MESENRKEEEYSSLDAVILKSSPYVFICCLMGIVIMQMTIPSDFDEFEGVATELFKTQWSLWVGIFISGFLTVYPRLSK